MSTLLDQLFEPGWNTRADTLTARDWRMILDHIVAQLSQQLGRHFTDEPGGFIEDEGFCVTYRSLDPGPLRLHLRVLLTSSEMQDRLLLRATAFIYIGDTLLNACTT